MEVDETFGECGSGDVLAGLFEGPLWFEDWSGGAVDEPLWMARIEEGFPSGVGVGTQGRVAVAGIVFAVVEDDDSGFGEEGWRACFGESAVEVTGPFGEDLDGVAGRVFYRSPEDDLYWLRPRDYCACRSCFLFSLWQKPGNQ